ncbi:DUF2141 domain-containing protein [Spirosoma linguale]|uniref:DUF2141 domain-containing protein n=1 Tax=Spirosoma linguale (strain ATCC 33905 / DSM 74 / LMG 10896 / Claus 1) TaxID=504472 RepID=D2QDH6_SPILD|nr:Protein of unknown function DUF2141 [Spirosoma linguale DSM 74]
MKTLLFTFALLTGLFTNTIAASRLAAPGDSATYKLTIDFTNVTKRTGTLYVGLVNDAADFNGNSYRKTRIQIPATGDFQVKFDQLPAGRYAVKVFQDLNDNQKLDKTNQMPTEPFGFSNVTMLMGPPSFEESAFEFNAPKTIVISLIGQ